MTSYPTRPGSFQHFLRSYLQDDGAGFRKVLTDEQIERVARLLKLSFGAGKNDIYSVPLTLWAFVTQAVSESKSCVAAVARVLAWLTQLGRPEKKRREEKGSGVFSLDRAVRGGEKGAFYFFI